MSPAPFADFDRIGVAEGEFPHSRGTEAGVDDIEDWAHFAVHGIPVGIAPADTAQVDDGLATGGGVVDGGLEGGGGVHQNTFLSRAAHGDARQSLAPTPGAVDPGGIVAFDERVLHQARTVLAEGPAPKDRREK
jgi:hypothetical protein